MRGVICSTTSKYANSPGPRLEEGRILRSGNNDFNTSPEILQGIRESYDGPLTLAEDLLVWNVNTDGVQVRRVIGTDEAWPAAPPQPAGPPDPSERTERSDWLDAGRVDLLN